jgi:alkylhydroperoxidase family enzyme
MADAIDQGHDFSAEALAAREALITGKSPRITQLPEDEIAPEVIDEVNAMRVVISLPPVTEVSEYTATMLRHPALYNAHMALATVLFRGALPVRYRELAVLRVGWLSRAPFEWGEHVGMGKRLGGITDAEIEQVIEGSGAAAWGPEDRAILRAVEECMHDAMISVATWTALAGFLDPAQLLELPIVIGHYQGTAYLQNSVRMTLMPANPGLTAR